MRKLIFVTLLAISTNYAICADVDNSIRNFFQRVQLSSSEHRFSYEKTFVIYSGVLDGGALALPESQIIGSIGKASGIVESYLPSKKQNLINIEYYDDPSENVCAFKLDPYSKSIVGPIVDDGEMYGRIFVNRKKTSPEELVQRKRCVYDAMLYFYGVDGNRSHSKTINTTERETGFEIEILKKLSICAEEKNSFSDCVYKN